MPIGKTKGILILVLLFLHKIVHGKINPSCVLLKPLNLTPCPPTTSAAQSVVLRTPSSMDVLREFLKSFTIHGLFYCYC